MAKGKVYLIHGWGGSPGEPIHKWICEKLIERGFEFIAPEMPNPEEPEINDWINKIKEVAKEVNEETIFIGHSIGCQAVLRFVETLNDEILGKVILIAPWMKLDEQTVEEEGEEVKEIAKPWMETPIDFDKIKKHCKNFVCIFSDNDPYVSLSEENFFKKKLNAKTLILNNRGHFDPSFGIKSLSELLEFIK